jgi:antitoxin HicB
MTSDTRTDTNYPVKIDFDDQDKLYVAEFLDLPGCSATGSTVEEAYQRAQTAKQDWLRLSREQGLPIPKPSRAEEYSGRFLLRLPPSLHAMLAERARLQASSLNQYVVHLLSGAVVGDSVSSQIDQLKRKVAGLESQLGQLSRNLDLSRPTTAQQTIGATVMVSTGVPAASGMCTWAGSNMYYLSQNDPDLLTGSDPYSGLNLDNADSYPTLNAGKIVPRSGMFYIRGTK